MEEFGIWSLEFRVWSGECCRLQSALLLICSRIGIMLETHTNYEALRLHATGVFARVRHASKKWVSAAPCSCL